MIKFWVLLVWAQRLGEGARDGRFVLAYPDGGAISPWQIPLKYIELHWLTKSPSDVASITTFPKDWDYQ